jgi:rhamnose transport system ATP-binding protein
MTAPLIEARRVSKAFAGVQALRQASFELRSGEVHALVGENGAGKSTLIRIFAGAETPDDGVLMVCGQRVEHLDPAMARSLGIAAIYQQPALFPDMTVAENIMLPSKDDSRWGRIHPRRHRRRAMELLKQAGSSISPDRLAGTLSMPEQQIVAIARALEADARVLILDEPTTSLTEPEVENLFALIDRLRDAGAGLIYISHRLDEITAIADRITVLRDGSTFGAGLPADINRADLIHLMVGRDLAAIFPKRDVPIGKPILELRGVSSRAAGISGVSLTVRSGEILGISGMAGSGRTELAETLFGITPADSGEILLNTCSVRIESPADAVRHRIGYVPEDRRKNGVILDMPIEANASLASLESVSSHGFLDRTAEASLAQRFIDRLKIRTPSSSVAAGSLSGGNQQKVSLARWLAVDPVVLILDEPTQGIDIGSKSEIHSQIVDMAERGLAIIMISSEMPEILGMSDTIAVMYGGTISALLPREQATPRRILEAALGHPAIPEPV